MNTPSRNEAWPVYEVYHLEDHPGAVEITEDNIVRHVYDPAKLENFELENRDFRPLAYPRIVLGPGVYVGWKGPVRKTYNPTRDEPRLFHLFCDLARKGKPNPDDILRFAGEYGVLKHVDDVALLGDNRAIRVKYPVYPLEAFAAYAQEAYAILRLGKAVRNTDGESARSIMLEFIGLFPIPEGIIQDLTAENGFLNALWPRLPQSARDRLHEEGTNWDVGNDTKHQILKHTHTDLEQIVRGFQLGCIFDPRPFFRLLLECAPGDSLLPLAAGLTAEIINLRLSDSVSPRVTSQVIHGFDRLDMLSQLKCNSLLSAIWLLFFFEITGVLQVPIKLCPECGRVIVNPRKNQKWHDGCRQKHYAHTRRQATRLLREGKQPDDVAKETGASLKTVQAWSRMARNQ